MSELKNDLETVSAEAAHAPPAAEVWNLRLYVAGQTPKSLTAFANLKRLCEILAIPTLVRKLPPHVRRIIGDLSNTERVLVGMDLVAEPTLPATEIEPANAS